LEKRSSWLFPLFGQVATAKLTGQLRECKAIRMTHLVVNADHSMMRPAEKITYVIALGFRYQMRLRRLSTASAPAAGIKQSTKENSGALADSDVVASDTQTLRRTANRILEV
jgi:hypothetical protein